MYFKFDSNFDIRLAEHTCQSYCGRSVHNIQYSEHETDKKSFFGAANALYTSTALFVWMKGE